MSCQNQNMENKNEDNKKVLHSRHARILKEEDEIWISSEDLNTENSSDDERSKSKQAFKKKLKLKHRKRSSPNIKVQRPSISSIPSTSSAIDERLLMPKSEEHQSRSDDSRTSDEEYMLPPISSECLSKRLSLEDWRPMKGALNASSLEEAASTTGYARKIANETNNFYNVMLYRLKDLKSCPVLKSARKEKSREQEKLPDEMKTFKYLKNTTEVKEKLNYINKMDEEISETIDRYKAEREERLETEFLMCKSISENKICQERDTEVFLKMCNFEERLKVYKRQADEPLPAFTEEEEDCMTDMDTENQDVAIEPHPNYNNKISTEVEDNSMPMSNDDRVNSGVSTNFIRRNIYTAKEGMMASFSLTDEEKTKIANILKDIDDFQLDDAELVLSSTSAVEYSVNNQNENIENRLENDTFKYFNAFAMPRNDEIRLNEINDELEKFSQEEKLNEKSASSREVTVIKDDEFWKQYVLDHSLRDIDAKLEKLYGSYVEDEEKLRRDVEPEVEDIEGMEVED